MENLTKTDSKNLSAKTGRRVVRGLLVAVVGSAMLLSGCGEAAEKTNDAETASVTETPGRTNTGAAQLLPLAERAERAKVSLEIAQTWEKQGVYIANSGLVYATECPVSRSVRIPAGVRIVC